METLSMEFFKDLGIAVALTIALVQVVKISFKVPDQFKPLSSLVIGLGITYLVAGDFSGVTTLTGLVVGTSAAGLYDQKAVVTTS